MCIFFLLLFLKMILLYYCYFILFKTFMWGMQFLRFPIQGLNLSPLHWKHESQSLDFRVPEMCIFSIAMQPAFWMWVRCVRLERQNWIGDYFPRSWLLLVSKPVMTFTVMIFIILGVEGQSQWQDGLHAYSYIIPGQSEMNRLLFSVGKRWYSLAE